MRFEPVELSHPDRTIFYSYSRKAFELSPVLPAVEPPQIFCNLYSASRRDCLDIEDLADNFETRLTSRSIPTPNA
jgi:hypothetical protein